MDQDYLTLFRSSLEAFLKSFGLEPLTRPQLDQMVGHYKMLREWNRRTNLTRIVEPEEAARLHYAESLFGLRFTAGSENVLDIGSGAGFPAVPLAVAGPGLGVTALEANQKKALFLNEVKGELSLPNFTVARKRVEEFDWTSYDLLTSRALDRAETVLPSVIRRLTPPQRLMLYCAPDLLARLGRDLPNGYAVRSHSIPRAQSRMIAVFSVEAGSVKKRD